METDPADNAQPQDGRKEIQRDEVERLIPILEHVRHKKAMFMHPVDGWTACSWLIGFSQGVVAFVNCGDLHEKSWDMEERRGWKRSKYGVIPQMQRIGMTDEAIADELFAIEIDLWTDVLNAWKVLTS